jgi:hypothetical protein
MQKLFLLALVATINLNSSQPSDSASCLCNSINYDWLIQCAKGTSYTDHIPHFRRLFNTMKVRTFLECGCGFSTKYFLDNCDHVVSVEFMNPGTDDQWYQKCANLYQNCVTNWTPILYNKDLKDESFNQACAYACSAHKDYSLIDSSYLTTLDLFFKAEIDHARKIGSEIDVAFVDAGVYTRGDMVKLLLKSQVPIVVAHDTACDLSSDVDEGFYVWFVVKTPPEYEKIYIPFGQGTTFWIHKKLPHVIESILNYKKMIMQAETFECITEYADRFHTQDN